MDINPHDRRRRLRILSVVILAAVGCAVVFGSLALVPASTRMAGLWPEFSELRLPLLALALACAATILAELAFCAVAVAAVTAEPENTGSLQRAITAIVVISGIQIALLAVVLTLIPGPPALALLLIAAVACALFVLVGCLKFRTRLRPRAEPALSLR